MKTPHYICLILASYILFFIQPCLSFSMTATMITDLISSNSADFQTEASAFNQSTPACPSCSNTYTTPPNSCGVAQETIFGGPGIMGPSGSSTYGQYYMRWYGNLNYQDLNTGLEFDLWAFYNSVPSNPSDISFLFLDFDGGYEFPKSVSSVLVSSCQLDYIDSGGVTIKAFYKFHVRVLFKHHWSSEIRTKLISQSGVASTIASFGFRNLRYYISSTISINSPISTTNFPCLTNFYWDGSVCVACNAKCSVCIGPTSNECSVCNSGYYNYGNGTCFESCSDPFQVITKNSYLYCQQICASDFFWFYNKSCSSTCDYPLYSSVDANGLKICSNPCYYNDATSAYVNKYLYPERTCLSTCSSPLKTKSPGLCLSPCTNVNDYTFQNGTCTSQCTSFLVASTVNAIKYCNSPCPGQYIYYDGTCLSQCEAPMVKRDESDIKYCVSPCTNPQYYFYEVDQKCLPTCSDPYEPQQVYNLKLCYLSGNLNVEQVQETKAMVAGLTSANSAGAAGGKASASLSSTSPALAFLAGQVSLLFSVRYINVGYPDKVKLMFKLQGASPFSLSINFNIPGGVERKLVKRSPPEIFEEYKVPSNFLENSWDTLLTLMLTLFSIGGLSVVVRMMKGKCPVVGSILGGVLSFLKWNIPLMIFCSSFGDMYFFASLQFHSGISGSTTWEVISFIIAILMMIIGLVVVILPVKIARDMLKEKEAEKKWENFGLLFSGQKRTSLVSLCYMAYYLGVSVISNLIIANLYAYPLCEALLVTMISLIMFLFLVIQRPLKEHKMFAQVIINQLLLITVNICVVILAIMDELEITRQDLRDKIGQAITMVFFCSMASGIAFAVIEVLFTLFYLYKFLKKFKAEQGTLSPKRILQSLMTNGNKEKKVKNVKSKLDVRKPKPTRIHKQSTDLSLGQKLNLQPPRKPQKNPLNISYQDSNTSGIDLIKHQSSDYSFDISKDESPDLSPSKFSKSHLSHQQRKNILKNVNHRIIHQKSDFSVEILNHSPVKLPKAVDIIQSPFENNHRNDVSSTKEKVNQTASQSQSPSGSRSSSPNRSYSKKGRKRLKKENLE